MNKKTKILTLLSTIALSAPAHSQTISGPGHQFQAAMTTQTSTEFDTRRTEQYYLNRLYKEAKASGSDDGDGKGNGKGNGGGDNGGPETGNGNGNGHENSNGDGHGQGGHGKGKDHEKHHDGYSFLSNSLTS